MEEKWQTITGMICLIGYLFCATRVYRYVLSGSGKGEDEAQDPQREDINNFKKTTKQDTKRKEEL